MPRPKKKFVVEEPEPVPVVKKIKALPPMWRWADVTMTFTNKIMAGVPKDPSLIRPWLEARKASDASFNRRKEAGEELPPIAILEEEVKEEVAEAPDREDQVTLVFKREKGHLFVERYTVKAHLKDSTRVLSVVFLKNTDSDIAALRSKVADRLYVEPEHIPVLRDGNPVTEGDAFWEHPVQA